MATAARKIFVLDTSVCAYDPMCFTSFKGNCVILPVFLLNELDKIKKYNGNVSRNARAAIRFLDQISETGDLIKGVKIENDIILKIDTSSYKCIDGDQNYGDNIILSCAAQIKKNNPKNKVILVSKDINMRVRARAFDIIAQDYEKDKIKTDDFYNGFRDIVNEDAGAELISNGVLYTKDYKELCDMYQNEFVSFLDANNEEIAHGRRVGEKIKLVKEQFPWNLKSKSREQMFLIDLILDPKITLVSSSGYAGTGKSLVCLASSLELVLNKRCYETVNIFKPNISVGETLGYLPGDLSEKLSPAMSCVSDSFNYLFQDKTKKRENWKAQLHQYLDNGTITFEAMEYIRGRSFSNAIILIEESQNITKEILKTLLTRVGNNSKIILNGDITQVDNEVLSGIDNGLFTAIEKFKTSELAGHVTLTKGERSPLATLASEML